MYEAIFDLEAITPLFMRGADARSPEFSSASVKGVMRWWFRALAGGYFGNNIEALKEVEEKIFGSTRNKSRVFVRAEVEDVKKGNIYRQASSWADKTIIVWSEYVDYFFFSVLDKRRNRKTKKIDIKTRFEYFDVGSKFSISLSSTDERYFRLAEASLWMTINLGGFGFRARRGAGSLKVTNAEGDVTLNFTKFDSLKKFSQELSNVVSQFNKAIRELDIKFEQSGREKEHYPNYPTFDQENSLVFTNEEWAASGKKETWIKALDNFGRWYLGRRRGRKFIDGFRFKFADYTLSHALEKVKEDSIIKTVNSEPLKEKRYYLGLPIRYANYGTTVSGWSGDLPLENKKLKKITLCIEEPLDIG
ncbi:MAG: CRISPR-associated protein Cmr1 [Pyrococcus sp.]|uniref:type III-B CRISPR module RAMP protein Cmr1 n=1 Tax=Pyrococcus sp. TaxID=33866 RepID=UPI00258A027E|nr:type III-B CRISPR module RAMP protein Cmr1 [Pyrococcus sp.]MDK2869282.1 CRISPR-associated protein Cmr1 [Pyrococcus sp.]